MADKSNDIFGVIKDIRQTGTQEMGNSMGSMLSATPPKNDTENAKPNILSEAMASVSKTPSVSGNQISVAQEKREKEVIDRRKESA